MITIVDYGMGNLGSVLNMFRRIGVAAEATSNLSVIEKAEKILLPGVGAFGAAMKRIEEGNFKAVLSKKALQDKVPVLGICLGMQLLTNGSEEAMEPGLGWINAEAIKFKFDLATGLKVPHMGWNTVTKKNSSPLTDSLPEDSKFYFVHSYFIKVKTASDCLMQAHYGIDFDAVITNGSNIFGAQFHPEKSHKFGMKLLSNFAAIKL
jgi:imidazole glycerol-phosphate synthase subunit HisH